jgi:2-polyprenyl-3-methyl-5-hydroxy-6-metoxy-1,4-benzoquinol methylase
VFVPTNCHLDPDSEKAQYDLHQNDLHDEGYRVFLSRLASPLMARLPPGASGLDFGCGPGPALAQILRDAGFKVALYDKFYAPDEGTLTRRFDFITATEVVEHLRRPGWELERLWSLLSSRGWLGIMTKLVRDPVAFAGWHYKNDPTHVCFYSADTWRWWAAHHGASLEIIGSDVILLRREA